MFLLLLLLDSLPVLLLLRAELILLLLVLPVQLGIRGGLNNDPWRSRNLVRMDCRRRTRAIGLRWLSRLLPGSPVCGCLLLRCLLLRGLLFGLFGGCLLSRLLLRGFLFGFFGDCLLLRRLLFCLFRCRLLRRLLLGGFLFGFVCGGLLLRSFLLGFFGGLLIESLVAGRPPVWLCLQRPVVAQLPAWLFRWRSLLGCLLLRSLFLGLFCSQLLLRGLL